MPSVVTFDAGLTLIDLDLDMLSQRLAERGVSVAPEALGRATPVAWKHYDALAPTSTHPWQSFMAKLLAEAGVFARSVINFIERAIPTAIRTSATPDGFRFAPIDPYGNDSFKEGSPSTQLGAHSRPACSGLHRSRNLRRSS